MGQIPKGKAGSDTTKENYHFLYNLPLCT